MRHRTVSAGALQRRSGWVALTAPVLAIALLLPGCSDGTTLEEWEITWREVVAAVPPLAEVIDDPAGTCSTTLGMLRAASADLIEAPNPDLRHALLTWSTFAEGVFFDCPPQSGAYAGFEASYREMARLADTVESLLSFEHGSR